MEKIKKKRCCFISSSVHWVSWNVLKTVEHTSLNAKALDTKGLLNDTCAEWNDNVTVEDAFD